MFVVKKIRLEDLCKLCTFVTYQHWFCVSKQHRQLLVIGKQSNGAITKSAFQWWELWYHCVQISTESFGMLTHLCQCYFSCTGNSIDKSPVYWWCKRNNRWKSGSWKETEKVSCEGKETLDSWSFVLHLLRDLALMVLYFRFFTIFSLLMW